MVSSPLTQLDLAEMTYNLLKGKVTPIARELHATDI